MIDDGLFSPGQAAAAECGEAIGRLCPTTGHGARDRREDPA
jgi:hypothetical protein